METAWLVYAADRDDGASLERKTGVPEQKMMRLLIACIWQAAIVSELVVGSLRRRNEGFWRADGRAAACVVAAAFSVRRNWIDEQLAQNVIQHTLCAAKQTSS
jgi:hypothetical protein